MSDHPSTFRGESVESGATEWDDHAELHRVKDDGGLLGSAKSIRSGTFTELIRYLLLLPEEEQNKLAIYKAGDRAYSAAEVRALASRDDFPA